MAGRYAQVLRATTGLALPGTPVSVYPAGSGTLATLYRDAAGTTVADNPVISDTGTGLVRFFAAPGLYDLRVGGALINESVPITDDAYLLAAGVTAIPRWLCGSATTISLGASGTVRFMFFQAPRTETITQVATVTGGTAAAATPTLCRMGVYSVGANGDLTLVGSHANDTALFAGTATRYAKTLTTPFALNAGTWYAFAVLVVTGGTLPTFNGVGLNASTAQAALAPRLTGQLAGQTDLPASVLAANVAASNAGIMGEILP